ncbi:MAG: hypothetical protein FWC97_06230, partial [Treponema sp.]|nr:hypothetical protein [Treponema sp.]
EQGEYDLRSNFDFEHRVTKMTENFIREFDQLVDQNIMGIFGAAHTTFGFYEVQGFPDIPTMAERLRERYGDSLHTTDLTLFGLGNNPIRVDIITINGVDYEASYFGTDLEAFRDVVSRSFWRLENAYDDFRNKPANGDNLPFSNYPMAIELYQVFLVDVARTDGSISRLFFRSDGRYWLRMPSTTGFIVE